MRSWRSISVYVRMGWVIGGAVTVAFAALALGTEPRSAQVAGVSGLCADRAITNTSNVAASDANPLDRPASDLYCVDLLSTALGGEARGVVEMGRVATPFGVAVTPEGHHQYALTAWIEDLPPPASLGPFNAYVAWATTPVFDQITKLGEVTNGTNVLGQVALNKFLIMVSAEASADVRGREGRLVLRGRSPSSLMEAHDMLAQAPSAAQAPPMSSDPGMEGNNWMMPPVYPGVRMLPGLMGLSPRPSPLVPAPIDAGDPPTVMPQELVELPDGGTLDLEAGFVRRELRGRDVVMMAFNRQHPGPLIKVREKSTIFVNFTNRTSLPTAVHWHGVRLDNRFDGVPGVTQDPVQPGETFQYRIFFRDAGIYWYHPHHREDVGQEMGLYGNMLVDPIPDDYYNSVNREEVLMLDDILLSENGLVPFGDESANYMLMGRFGNLMLVNGEPEFELDVDRGEVVRFFLINVSNTRTFNVSFRRSEPEETSDDDVVDPDRILSMKVVGSDVGRFEHEVIVTNAVIATAERYVLEVRFPEPGRYSLVNHVQGINHRRGVFLPEITLLGSIRVSERDAEPDYSDTFRTVREHEDVVREIDTYRPLFDKAVDRELILTLEVSDLPAPVEQSMLYDWIYFNPVEWTGTMPMMNWASSGTEVGWILRDPATGLENMDIDWSFRVGDVVKIRIVNDRGSFHAMQHPLHIHGQRFLVLEQDGVQNDNLVWKDTVLLPTGSTTDILLELSNPGRWMVHCHIAEHLESGMKFVMEVEGQ